jgi:hypothetical protein
MASIRGAGPTEELYSCAMATMMRAATPAPKALPKIPITSGAKTTSTRKSASAPVKIQRDTSL